MNETELKRRAEKRRKIPEEAWATLLEDGYVEAALERNFDEEAVDYILEKFDRYDAAFGRKVNRTQTADRERNAVTVSLSESELERKAAFEEYAATCAACEDGTRRFRNSVLGDRLLTAEQARALVRSPAAQFFKANYFEFREGDIRLIGHQATLVHYDREEGKDGKGWHHATVYVDPPGISKTVEKPSYAVPRSAIKGPGRTDIGDGRALHYVNERGRARKVPVWDWSPLEQLRSLSEELAQRYRWEPAQSTMFVLTGEIPAVPALRVTKWFRSSEQILDDATWITEHLDATIDVTAAAWVPSTTVAKAYRKAQIEVLGSSGGKPPGQKNLRLFRFVTERMQPLSEAATDAGALKASGRTKMPLGKDLVREWNRAHPQWAYETSVGDLNTRLFWRDYKRIKKTIAVGPPYRRPRPATGLQSE